MTTVPDTHATGDLYPPDAPTPSRRVLVVDAEPMIPRLLATQLSPHGFAVTLAGSVARAAGEIRQGSFDLILLDMDLQSGARPLELLAPGVPIVLLSADVDREVRVERPYGTGVLLPKFQPTDRVVPRLRELCEAARDSHVRPADGPRTTTVREGTAGPSEAADAR